MGELAASMRNLVPQFIMEQFVRGRFNGRFQAAALFMDISGFTATSNIFMQHSMNGGEAMADVMQSIFDPLVEAVYGQGGFITGFAGDAFTAVFPDVGRNRSDFSFIPSALSSSPSHVRALAAAVHMQRHMQEAPHRQTTWGRFTFAIKIGLAYGEVEWGIVGDQGFESTEITDQLAHAYYFRGSAIDECSLSEMLADNNEMVVAASLYVKVRELVQVEAIDEGNWRVTAVHGTMPPLQPSYLIPPDANLLRIFVPSPILQQQVRGEYRHVFTLFLQLQNVQTNQRLNEFVRHVFRLQKQYGGYLNTVQFGDKGCNLLLFWGMPISFENDVERALNFVLRLRQETAVPFRAGISYRLMYAGFVGSSAQRQEYSCYGRGVNLASRLMLAAPWGSIWIDENVARRAIPYFVLSQQGRYLLKGFGEPQPVFALYGRRAATRAHYKGRMVARQRELANLAAWIRPLQDGRFPGIAHIFGEAGIGKSRLIAEFRAQILQSRLQQSATWQWFACQTDEILRQSLNPFRQLLREYFQQEITNTPDQNLRTFTQKFSNLLSSLPENEQQGELKQLQIYLRSLLDLPIDDLTFEQVSIASRFNNTLLALRLLFIAESQRQPVILHIEDVHWLDDDSWRFLAQLARTIDQSPIAIILTGRSSNFGSNHFPIDSIKLPIELFPLSSAGLADLALNVIGRAPTPELVEEIAKRSDGNPFFAEQILLYLDEQNLLNHDPAADSMMQYIPADVRAVMVARLDSLPQAVREVVQQAAILGREFDVQLLAHMLRSEKNLLTRISEAERASIWVAVSQLRYLFKHALLRDAAYDMQLQARRQKLHKAAAEALESIYASDLSRHYAELVYHYRQANWGQKEGHFAALAGIQAAEQFANLEAEEYLTRALDMTPVEDVDAQYTLLLHLENVHNVQGNRDAQKEDLNQLFGLVEELNDDEKTAVIYNRQARYANFISDYSLAEEAAEKCVTLSSSIKTAATGYLYWSRACWRQGDYPKAQALIVEAWQRYRKLDDREGYANTLNEAGIISQYLAQHAESRACFEQALTIFRETGNRLRLPTVMTNFGNLQYSRGRYSQAFALYEEANSIWEQQGYQQGMGISQLNKGVSLRDMGNYAEAEACFTHALPMSQQLQEKTMEGAVLTNMTLLYHQMGDQETAVSCARRALPILNAANSPHFEASAHTWLAHALTEQALYDEAILHYREAISLHKEMGERQMVLEAQAGLARIEMFRERMADMCDHSEAIWLAVQENPELPNIHERGRVYLTGYRCLHALDDPRALTLLFQGYELLQKLAGFLDNDAQRQMFLHEIQAHRELISAWEASQNV